MITNIKNLFEKSSNNFDNDENVIVIYFQNLFAGCGGGVL